MSQLTAKDVIFTLGLKRHPAGGWYARTFGDGNDQDGPNPTKAIYLLLEDKDGGNWHHVDATEVWNYYTGAPLELTVSDGTTHAPVTLGPDADSGQHSKTVLPRRSWQSARTVGAWTLVGCRVPPGFQFSSFDTTQPAWSSGTD
ncbi:cupin domain-containing protein [Devosia algicola]|uniref:Cupin domain-containing protein n=1 Tax=Devosia algicola TaxID=3026418 RepID=A0ABY7YQH1_9HYPH|nr:cupin domain-containing protein [Devosia algicola]WDR03576.1 cupin domain-containing protein [Devosia algicola]